MKRFYAFRVAQLIESFFATPWSIVLSLVLIAGFLKPEITYATHAAGADIAYQWISGNTYQVTCTFYRDCGGVNAPNTVTLRVRSASLNVNFTQTLQRLNPTGQEITFSCTGITNFSVMYIVAMLPYPVMQPIGFSVIKYVVEIVPLLL
jgi:hypothetical protein